MAELSAKDLILLCPTALPGQWVWTHSGAQAQTLQSLQEPRGSSTLFEVSMLCSSQPALLNSVCVWRDGAESSFPSVLPSLFPAGLVCNCFAEYAVGNGDNEGFPPCYVDYHVHLPSNSGWQSYSVCRVPLGSPPGPGEKQGTSWSGRASSQHHSARMEDLASRSLMAIKGCHCKSLWAKHPTSSSPREKEDISTASAEQFCFCHALSLTLCKLELALSKVRDEPKPSAWIDYPKLPWVFHVQRHWEKYRLVPN